MPNTASHKQNNKNKIQDKKLDIIIIQVNFCHFNNTYNVAKLIRHPLGALLVKLYWPNYLFPNVIYHRENNLGLKILEL